MIAIAYPAILFLIIPVIAVEAAYLYLRLRTGWKNTLGAVAKANAITMLLGFPLAWSHPVLAGVSDMWRS